MMPQLGWTAQPDGFIDFYNHGWYEYTGATIEEMQSGWDKLHDPEMLIEVNHRWQHSIATGEPFEMKFPLRSKEGSYYWFLTRANPIHNAEGDIIHWVGVSTNIQDEIDRIKQIEASEAKFRQLAETLPHIVWIVDNSNATTYLNQECAKYCGRDVGLGLAWRELVHPDDLKSTDEAWQQCQSAKTPYQVEQRLLSANGTYRWFLVRGVPVFDETGNVSSWFGTCTDIQDERESAERENEHFQLMTEAMPVATWSTGPDGRCEYVNRLWLEAANTTLDKVVGDGWLSYLHPDDWQAAAEAWRHFIEDDRPYEVEFRIKGKDGYRWYLTRGKKVADANGKVIKIVGGCTDIHAQRQLAEELERLVQERTRQLTSAKNFTDLVIDSMSDALVVTDSEGRLSYLNSAARAFYPDRHLPATIQDIPTESMRAADGLSEIFPEDLPIARALRGEVINDFEFIWGKKVVAVSARAIRESDGSISGSVATIRDITVRKQAEREIERARDEAIAASQAKSRFLANVSHEVRTPMAGVMGLVELIACDTQSGDDIHDMAVTALDSCQQLHRILSNLLDASSLQAGAVSLDNRKFSVRPVVGDVVQLASPEALQKHLELTSYVAENVPEFVWGDEFRVRQILQNLVFNALKFTERGKISISIDLLTKDATASRLRFCVADTGIGIPEEQQKKIFEPFAQAEDSTTRVYGGSGLGLSISQALVNLMEGEIGFESKINQGSTFWVVIPFGDDLCQK